MTNSDEETINKQKGLRKVGVAICVRICFGLLLFILGAVAIGYHNSRGIPYYLGGLLVGFTMSIADIVNIRQGWFKILRGTASPKGKDRCIRIETIISAISVMLAIPGAIITGVNGIQKPRVCTTDPYTCSSDELYVNTTTYKLALSLVLFLIASIFINMVSICQASTLDRPKEKVSITVGDQHQQESFVQGSSNNQEPVNGAGSAWLEMSTRHGQSQPFTGEVLSTEPRQHAAGNSSTGFVLSTRHGQPQPFTGAVLSTGSQQPASDYPSSGLVLNTRHGQPEPFAGVILSTAAQQTPILQANYSLISELQEQNRLLRDQLALQQRRPESREQHVAPSAPSAPVAEAPPSYDACVSDPSRFTGV